MTLIDLSLKWKHWNESTEGIDTGTEKSRDLEVPESVLKNETSTISSWYREAKIMVPPCSTNDRIPPVLLSVGGFTYFVWLPLKSYAENQTVDLLCLYLQAFSDDFFDEFQPAQHVLRASWRDEGEKMQSHAALILGTLPSLGERTGRDEVLLNTGGVWTYIRPSRHQEGGIWPFM